MLARSVLVLTVVCATASVALAERAEQTGGYATIGVGVGVPMGDLDDVADTSPGARIVLGYRAAKSLAVYGTFRYLFVNSETTLADLSYLDYGLGVSFLHDVSPKAQVFVGLEGLMARTEVETLLGDGSETDPALTIRGGFAVALQPGKLDFIGTLAWTEIFPDDDSVDSARWLELGVGLRAHF